jgi:aquaporin Z
MEFEKKLFKLYVSEFIGTGVLLAVGLSIVIFDWGNGSVVGRLIPSIPERRLLTGFLFGCTGCLVTLSPVGKISGTHINPAVSIAFWLRGKMKHRALAGYIISQMLGAVVGCLPLLLWGNQGHSIAYGNTVPGSTGIWPAFWGEVITTACLIIVIFVFVGSKKLREYTPYTMPVLYCIMVWAEAALSGCSTNPARSFGPDVVSGVYTSYWLYVVAPLLGVLIVVVIFRVLRLRHYFKIHNARMSYHDRSSPQTE